jgi:hypothetical protein
MILLASLRSDEWTAWSEHVDDFIGPRIGEVLGSREMRAGRRMISASVVQGQEREIARAIGFCTSDVLTAGATGFEPAIFGLTGRHVNRYTTPPEQARL